MVVVHDTTTFIIRPLSSEPNKWNPMRVFVGRSVTCSITWLVAKDFNSICCTGRTCCMLATQCQLVNLGRTTTAATN
jgi:hypothetical protein